MNFKEITKKKFSIKYYIAYGKHVICQGVHWVGRGFDYIIARCELLLLGPEFLKTWIDMMLLQQINCGIVWIWGAYGWHKFKSLLNTHFQANLVSPDFSSRTIHHGQASFIWEWWFRTEQLFPRIDWDPVFYRYPGNTSDVCGIGTGFLPVHK